LTVIPSQTPAAVARVGVASYPEQAFPPKDLAFRGVWLPGYRPSPKIQLDFGLLFSARSLSSPIFVASDLFTIESAGCNGRSLPKVPNSSPGFSGAFLWTQLYPVAVARFRKLPAPHNKLFQGSPKFNFRIVHQAAHRGHANTIS
jgi:hypothetical protein